MNNHDCYQLINFVSNKDRQGSISIGKYYVYDGSKSTKFRLSTIFASESRNLFDFYLRRYFTDWKARQALEPFLDEIDNSSTSGSGSVAYSVMTRPAKIIEARSDQSKFIEVVENRGEWYDRLNKTIKAPSTTYPVMRLKGDSFEIRPTSVSDVDIIYLKYPLDPVIDGYYDSNDNFVYLEEGQTVNFDVESGTALDGTASGSYPSKTVEMEWDDEEKFEVVGRILADLGVSINKQSLVQYSQMIKTED